MAPRNKATYGEKLVAQPLAQIMKASPKTFFYQDEYRIFRKGGATSKPDFVVVLAEYGVGVIEVKDWVQILEAGQKTITLKTRTGDIRTERNPVEIAQDYTHDLNEVLLERNELTKKYRGKVSLKFPWQPIVILPNIPTKDIHKLEKQKIFAEGVVLGKEALSEPQKLYEALCRLPWKFSLDRPLSGATLDALRGVLNPYAVVLDKHGEDIGTATRLQESLIVENLPSAEAKQLDMFDALSEEARQVVNNHTVRLVRGVAGSGKTLVLLNRALFLREHYPHSQSLMLTFNRDLADYLHRRTPQIQVLNFHRLCSKIIGRGWHSPQDARGWLNKYQRANLAQMSLPSSYDPIKYAQEEFTWRKDLGLFDTSEYLDADRIGRTLSFSQERRQILDNIFQEYLTYQRKKRVSGEGWMDWDDVPYEALRILETQRHELQSAYDTVLIDEGQDFAPSWLQVVKRTVKPDGSLFICDDPTQSLYRYFSWRQKGVEVVGRTRVLKVPFRSSRQISLAAYSLVQADSLLSKSDDITQPNLDSPELYDGTPPTLYTFRSNEHEKNTVYAEVFSTISEDVPPDEIAVLCHNNYCRETYKPLSQHKVYVESFSKMKGLEFRVVFIPQIHTLFEQAEDETEITRIRQRIFTAMTRARYQLTLSHHGVFPTALDPILPHVWHESP